FDRAAIEPCRPGTPEHILGNGTYRFSVRGVWCQDATQCPRAAIPSRTVLARPPSPGCRIFRAVLDATANGGVLPLAIRGLPAVQQHVPGDQRRRVSRN